MPINLGFATVNETTVIVLVLSFFIYAFYREIKRLRGNLQHRQIDQEMQELKGSASSHHKVHHIPAGGRAYGRPVVMAAIQEEKTEVMEHFVKKRFRKPEEKII